jgi:hypothetical protein
MYELKWSTAGIHSPLPLKMTQQLVRGFGRRNEALDYGDWPTSRWARKISIQQALYRASVACLIIGESYARRPICVRLQTAGKVFSREFVTGSYAENGGICNLTPALS